jgi:hypothetical protein
MTFEEAWDRLQSVNPWKYTELDVEPFKADILLGISREGKPCVVVMRFYWDYGFPEELEEGEIDEVNNFCVSGNTPLEAVMNTLKLAEEGLK